MLFKTLAMLCASFPSWRGKCSHRDIGKARKKRETLGANSRCLAHRTASTRDAGPVPARLFGRLADLVIAHALARDAQPPRKVHRIRGRADFHVVVEIAVNVP